MRASGLGVVALGAWLSLGCAMNAAKAAFLADFDCPRATAEATNVVGRYRVEGCGRTAIYVCMNDSGCVRRAVSGAEEPTPQEAKDLGSKQTTPRVEATTDGSLMKLELVLDRRTRLRLTATPNKVKDRVQVKLLREVPPEEASECALDFMVNGQRLSTPPAMSSRQGSILSHRVQLGRELIEDFGAAKKIALRACDERWGLTGEQVQGVRDFVERFREEVAWKAPREAAP
jgi:hypothetical protein